MHGNVDIVEEARADHVDLARAPLFCGRPINADATRRAGVFQPVADRDRRRDRARAEQVVATGVACALAVDFFAIR